MIARTIKFYAMNLALKEWPNKNDGVRKDIHWRGVGDSCLLFNNREIKVKNYVDTKLKCSLSLSIIHVAIFASFTR